jgi:hypothetical protein
MRLVMSRDWTNSRVDKAGLVKGPLTSSFPGRNSAKKVSLSVFAQCCTASHLLKSFNGDDTVSPHYHHSNVYFQLLVDSVVQDQIHELIKTPQNARNVTVGVEVNCEKNTTDYHTTNASAARAQLFGPTTSHLTDQKAAIALPSTNTTRGNGRRAHC